MFVDPDWKPVSETLNKDDLVGEFTNYFFTIFDRNGKTTRSLDWLVIHEPGLRMLYNWHEQWDYPPASPYASLIPKTLPWQVSERDDNANWHQLQHAGGGGSFSYERYLFELSEMERDWHDTVEGGGRRRKAVTYEAVSYDVLKICSAVRAPHFARRRCGRA